MLPWNYGLEWNAWTVVFLGAFYAVVVVVGAVIVSAVVRSRRAVEARRPESLRWRSDFEALTGWDRACRHALTGRLPNRECENAFDCGHCETHARQREAKATGEPEGVEDEVLGMAYPRDRYYHRAHTWARPESDGTVSVGLDAIGERLLGRPDAVDLPARGTRIEVNGTAWRVWRNNVAVRLISPVNGRVVAAGGPDGDWYLRVRPDRSDLSHLLHGEEVRPWVLHEIARLERTLRLEGEEPAGEGGAADDIATRYPGADLAAICGEMFLQG